MKPKKIPLILLSILTFLLFKNNQSIQQSILESCYLYITKLFPSLFPMMVLSDCFIYFGLPELLCKYFGTIFTKLFKTSPYGAFAFFISCFSGTPSNAYVIKNLYMKNYMNEKEAEKILSFAFFSNPLFLYIMLSLIFPNNPFIKFKLLALPYLVNIGIGILSKKEISSNKKLEPQEKINFGTFLTNTIRTAMNTQLLILGSITLFFLINKIINPNNLLFISGILEISQGLNRLIECNNILKIKELLTCFFISFGGFSIHLQIKGILSDTNISYLEFLKGRIKQTIFSIFFIIIF